MAVSPVDLGQGSQDEVIAQPLVDVDLDRAPRRSRWYLEALVIVWLMWAYDLIANLAHLRLAAAIADGRSILHLEAVLHIDPERTLDRWLTGHHTIGLWVATYYDNAHFVVTLAVIVWLWWRHPLRYRRLRTTLVLVNVIGFVVFWLYPTAPPRMLSGAHIGDVVAGTGAIGSWHSGQLAQHANELAAMPSLHMAWAAWSALAVWLVLRRHHRWALLVWAYPVATALAVLATGNHYLLDVVAGLATLVVAMGGAMLVGRWAQRIPVPARLARLRA
ncbi:MAG: phosphatase PAP2 family protein [Actinomycetota bacterium]|nr:phosphatase PAP2 family protein [Actinomycetota bacterium]